MTTARFWVFINLSWVKITLNEKRPTVHHYKGEYDEEGWSSEANVWRLEDNNVIRETTNDGTDCDGRLTQHYDCICPLDQLRGHFDKENNISHPIWQKQKAWQRDLFAELMGY